MYGVIHSLAYSWYIQAVGRRHKYSGQFIIIIYPYIYLIPFKSKCIVSVSIRVLYGNLKQKRLIYSYFIIINIYLLSVQSNKILCVMQHKVCIYRICAQCSPIYALYVMFFSCTSTYSSVYMCLHFLTLSSKFLVFTKKLLVVNSLNGCWGILCTDLLQLGFNAQYCINQVYCAENSTSFSADHFKQAN